jgi:hypothetical protein
MHIHLAPQFIETLAVIISGGGGNDQPPIGVYRSASKLESFMRGCNVAVSVGTGSQALEKANGGGDQTILKNIVKRAADPRNFLNDPDRLQAVIDHLNARLSYDGLELQRAGQQVRLGAPGRSASVVDALVNAVAVIDFDTVNRDLERALASAETDPEVAVSRRHVQSSRASAALCWWSSAFLCRRRRTSSKRFASRWERPNSCGRAMSRCDIAGSEAANGDGLSCLSFLNGLCTLDPILIERVGRYFCLSEACFGLADDDIAPGYVQEIPVYFGGCSPGELAQLSRCIAASACRTFFNNSSRSRPGGSLAA